MYVDVILYSVFKQICTLKVPTKQVVAVPNKLLAGAGVSIAIVSIEIKCCAV